MILHQYRSLSCDAESYCPQSLISIVSYQYANKTLQSILVTHLTMKSVTFNRNGHNIIKLDIKYQGVEVYLYSETGKDGWEQSKS